MLVGLSITLALSSCKKDVKEEAAANAGTNQSTPTQTMSRTYSQDETDVIVAQAEAFQAYANELRRNGTPIQGDLPDKFTMEGAVAILENTTNYYYGRPNHFRPNDSTATFSSPCANSIEISLQEIASKYNAFRSQFKSFYESFGDEKSFGFTDFEYNAQTNAFVAISDIRYGAEDLNLTAWQGITGNQGFNSSNGFYNVSWPQTSSSNLGCPNTPEAADVLSLYVKQNLGFYNSANTYYGGPIPIATSITSFDIDATQTEAQTSNFNPMVNWQPDIINYNCFFSQPFPDARYNANPNFFNCLNFQVMDYYRAEQRQMVLNKQNAIAKTCIKYQLSVFLKPDLGSHAIHPYIYQHMLRSGNYQFANLIYVRKPSLESL
jgi:hypothetical protein